jgi:hypothetical protein
MIKIPLINKAITLASDVFILLMIKKKLKDEIIGSQK